MDDQNPLNQQPIAPQPDSSPTTPVVSQPPVSPPMVPTHKKSDRWAIILIALVGVLIMLIALLRIFVFAPYKENGPSMAPTINNGQQLIILKEHSQPKRGAIIIFTQTGLSKYGQPNTLNLIKRVVGLPGDRVQIKNNRVTIFNAANPQGFNPDSADGLGNQVTSGNINTVVPQGEVYVLGDNRPNSLDSREFGSVPVTSIIGRFIHTF